MTNGEYEDLSNITNIDSFSQHKCDEHKNDLSCCNIATSCLDNHSIADIIKFKPLIKVYGNTNKPISIVINQCEQGLFYGIKPILASNGEGGTYFLRDIKNNNIACFKPSDEEVGCINNPRHRVNINSCDIKTIKPGDGYKREIAAYLLDNNHFHDVPLTVGIECTYNGFHYNTNVISSNSKIGSLQKFISGEVSDNFGIKNYSIREVHKIGLLDIRILNTDRNSGNILVSRDNIGRYKLTPIDHGLAFPEKIEIIHDSWVWLDWNQSKQPFDPYTLSYINSIDIDTDIKTLSYEFDLSQTVFDNMRVAHLVLIKYANMGFSLYDIANIMTRKKFDTPSILEELMMKAEKLAMEEAYIISENHKTVVRNLYYYYLDELITIECEEMIKRHKQNDNDNQLYDLDTIHGSFIWKNDLRINWLKSRIERKKAMQKLSHKLPPINPFEGYTFTR
eukprot:145755_1